MMRSGNSSAGRARPCQGRGREFESPFPLQITKGFARILANPFSLILTLPKSTLRNTNIAQVLDSIAYPINARLH